MTDQSYVSKHITNTLYSVINQTTIYHKIKCNNLPHDRVVGVGIAGAGVCGVGGVCVNGNEKYKKLLKYLVTMVAMSKNLNDENKRVNSLHIQTFTLTTNLQFNV